MTFDKEMQKALEADGEKLRGLTGQDHGPHFGGQITEKVWIVFRNYGYEGCSEPKGAYSSEALAKIAASHDYSELEIVELTLDQPLR